MCSIVESPPSCNAVFNSDPSPYWSPSTNASNEDRIGLICATDLILSGQFKDISSASTVNVYLTDSCIIVATNGGHLRTHYLKEIDISQEEGSLIVKDEQGLIYNYKPVKASPIDLWIHKITTLQHDANSIDLSICSLPSSQGPLCRPPSFKVHRPSLEWHGEQFTEISNSHLQTSTSDDAIKQQQTSSLKRRQAFRSPDKLRLNRKHRASSAPPDKESVSEGIVITPPQSPSSSDHLLSPVATKPSNTTSSSAPSSLRKKKIKFPPKARKFTRALSAKLMNTPLMTSSAHSSPKLSKKEFQRNHSFQSDLLSTASLPRTLPNKYIVRKNHSLYLPNSPDLIPTTPTRLRSPGNLLKLFQRKRIYSVTPQHSFDGDTLDGCGSSDSNKDFILHRSTQFKLYCHSAKVIAQELALIDSELFRKIKLSELQDGAWTKKTKQVSSPNVLAMIESFNHLARVVCTDIVHEKSLHSRAKTISTYIQLARECYRLHNYNSMKAVISGLQSQPVYRLTRSWNNVPSRRRKKYNKLSRLCSDMDSGTLQDEMLHKLQSRIHCIPYLGWLLTNILHWQVYSKLHRGGNRARSASLSARQDKKWRRDSVCSISMPTSPIVPPYTETERGEEREVLPLASPILIHFSKSLSDIPSSRDPTNTNIYSIITHPLEDELPEQTPPISGYMERSPSIESDDIYSLKADSAIGLDSSMSQASPLRGGATNNSNNEEKGDIIISNSHFDSYDDSDAESEVDGCSTSFIDQTNVSSSSSSTSFLSPSMITLSLKEEVRRRVTIPHIQAPLPPTHNSTIYYDFTCGGVLFSTCVINNEVDPTRKRLNEVARQLFITQQEQISPNNTPVLCDSNKKSVVSPPLSPPTRHASLTRQQDSLVLFEQYQVNTLNYLTEYCSNGMMRKLIINSPCVDDNECYRVSLEIDP